MAGRKRERWTVRERERWTVRERERDGLLEKERGRVLEKERDGLSPQFLAVLGVLVMVVGTATIVSEHMREEDTSLPLSDSRDFPRPFIPQAQGPVVMDNFKLPPVANVPPLPGVNEVSKDDVVKNDVIPDDVMRKEEVQVPGVNVPLGVSEEGEKNEVVKEGGDAVKVGGGGLRKDHDTIKKDMEELKERMKAVEEENKELKVGVVF